MKSMTESFLSDLRFSVRTLRKSTGFTAAAVTMLAMGIGVNAAVFTVIKAALFAGFALVEDNDRLVYISHRGCCVSYPDFEDWRTHATSFEGLALVHGVQRVISDRSGFAESHDVTEVTPETFDVVGQRPILGRDFTLSDAMPGAAPVAILNYGFWERRYGKDPSIVGRTLRINGAPTTVIGIMPEGFSFPQKLDLWVPFVPTPEVRRRDARDTWFVFGRLREGATIQSARAELDTIGRRLERDYPMTNKGVLPLVQNFREFFIFENDDIVYASMWGAVGFVLLISCANLANLLLARAMGRAREMSIRISLGAGKWQIIRQLLIESLMLSALGAAFGWWMAKWGVAAYELADRGPGRSSWRVLDYTMDYSVFVYIVAISTGTALLFGLAPALRLSKLDVNTALRDGGRGAAEYGGKQRFSAVLVTAEVALALVLLAGAGVMTRSFLNIYNGDLGVATANVLTVSIGLPASSYPDEDSWVAFFDRLQIRLEAIPGVESVALTARLPTDGSRRLPFELEGTVTADAQRRPLVSTLIVGPEYFRTLGANVLSGREFQDGDDVAGVPAVLVNEQFAAAQWPGENPLGQRLRLHDPTSTGKWLTVVGVVANIVQDDRTRQAFGPVIYLPYRQTPARSMNVVARTRVPPESLRISFRRAVQAIDPDLPTFGPFTLAERLEGTYWTSGLQGSLFLIFAAIALLLASLGMYAVIAHSLSQRTQEMGIRLAIGATGRDILRLVFAQGLLPLGVGLTVGLAAAFAVNQVLRSQLVQVSPSDPFTLLVASVVLSVSAALGCWIPARRAMRIDPLVALRQE